MDDLDREMREVLLALSLVAQGRTASWNSTGGGERDHTPIGFTRAGDVSSLDPDQDPAGHFQRLYDDAATDDDREHVLQRASRRLDEIRGRGERPNAAAFETKAERDRRIVEEGTGWPARELAVVFRCGMRDIWKAREAAGRDTELGLLPQDLSPAERDREIRRLDADGVSTPQIARIVGCSISTVRRRLGRKL